MEEVVMGKAVMGEFTPRHNSGTHGEFLILDFTNVTLFCSGKTAPRLIRDLLEYDAKRAWPEGKNLLTDPPPIWRDNGKLHPLRTKPNDCKHKLWRKDDRFLPPVGKIPTLNSKFLASSYCSRCFYHFDLLIDFTKRPDRGTPCRLGSDVPLHHFRYCSTKKRTEDVSKYDNFKEIHTFACSNLNCPAVLDIRITPPRLGKGFLSNICDAATVHARGLKAVANDPERLADSQPLSPGDVLIVLRTYLNDALAAKAKKRINDRNKKWLLAFGTDCDDLFEYLDFTVEVEDNQDPINPKQDRFWVLPTVEPISQADIFQRTRGHFLSDVIYELAERLSEAKPNYSRVHNVLATHDLYSVLGCLDYLTASRSVVNLEEQEAEHPHYAALGAVNDFPDELIAFAYDRQSDCDFKNKPYYLEALQGIANGRHSVELQEKAVMAISMGENTLSEIEDAYKYFNIDPESASGEEHIIGNYQSRIESSPLQKEDAKQQLRIIGQSRGSERILSVANDDTMSVPEAFELLGVTQDIPSDSISAMAIAIASDGDKNRVVKALRVIAEHRNDWELHLYANNIESGDSTGASNIAEAYRRLQIQDQSMRDESVISYYQTLCNTAAAGSKASYTDALRTIAASRNSVLLKAYATNPDAPIPIEKGTNEDPVGLDNIGNTCYLNSLLQYYYTVKPVRNVVMNFEDYRMPLNLADMQKKRVGGRAVSKGEVLKAQKCESQLPDVVAFLANCRQSSKNSASYTRTSNQRPPAP
jgi:ubiquitin carboxyl-terminal hydrolase 25/28